MENDNPKFAGGLVDGRPDLTEVTRIICNRLGIEGQMIDELGIKHDRLFGVMVEVIAEYGDLHIRHFGSFRLKNVAAESGIDPNGNHYNAPERLKVEFTPFKELRDEIEKQRGKPCIE
jgi:nucleoid DNA-binding protein